MPMEKFPIEFSTLANVKKKDMTITGTYKCPVQHFSSIFFFFFFLGPTLFLYINTLPRNNRENCGKEKK